jgi:hypothetical protein
MAAPTQRAALDSLPRSRLGSLDALPQKSDRDILDEGALLLARSAALQLEAAPGASALPAGPGALAICASTLASWMALSLPLRVSFLVTTLALLLATFSPGYSTGLRCAACHGAPPERVRAASLAWALGAWGLAAPGEAPLLAQEDFVFLGTAQAYHNFSRGCGSAEERAGELGWRWRPRASTAPSYPTWSRAATCAALAGSNLVVIGDSLSGEFFDTLVAALAHRPDYNGVPRLNRCWKRRICGGPGETPAFAHLITAQTFVVDDAFGNEFSTPEGAGEAESSGSQGCAPMPNQDQLAGRMAWREQLLVALEGEPASAAALPPVLIANTGAHYYGDTPGAEESVWEFFAYARLLAPRAALFYRTTPAGHPGCGAHRHAPPLQAALPLQTYMQDESTVEFMWWRFANFTARIAAGLDPAVVLVDVDLATALRIDSHPYRDNLAGLAHMAADCLHYCIPGPIDTWVEMFAALLRLQRLGEDAPLG